MVERKMTIHAQGGRKIIIIDKRTKECKEYSALVIYKGTPKADTPKSYKEIGGFVAHELSNAYNSGCVTIYRASDKTLRYSVYRDGCFYPYYGRCRFVE